MNSNDIMFLPGGVSEEFAEKSGLGFGYITEDYVRGLLKSRRQDAHKGAYGHALIVCGSKGMMGAASLATGAALRSGCGLVTVHIPDSERFPVEANFPSALFSLDPKDFFSMLPDDLTKYNAVGVGCGLGRHAESADALADLLGKCKSGGIKMVIDADALNIISENPSLCGLLPEEAILTPHMGELKRLIGEWIDEEDKLAIVSRFCELNKCIIVLKGPNTSVCYLGKILNSNSTGNAGMAKGGSGDVLTGYIAGLLARGYNPREAAEIGVYVHGAAGDKTCDYFGAEGMNSSDMIDFIAEVMKEFE